MNTDLNIINNKTTCGDQVLQYCVYIDDINGDLIDNRTLEEIANYCEQTFPDDPLKPITWRWNLDVINRRHVLLFLTQEDATQYLLSMI